MLGLESGDPSERSDSDCGLGFERFRGPIKDDLEATELTITMKESLVALTLRSKSGIARFGFWYCLEE